MDSISGPGSKFRIGLVFVSLSGGLSHWPSKPLDFIGIDVKLMPSTFDISEVISNNIDAHNVRMKSESQLQCHDLCIKSLVRL